MSENIKYSKAETEKYIKTLKRASKSNSHDLLIKYAESPNINMRIAAAGNLAAKDYLIEDPDYRVSKTMTQTIIRNNPNSAHDFLSSPKMEIRSCAAIFLAEKGLLTENELEDLDIPIVRNLIFKRLYLKEIASIYKNGDIKTLLNDELNIMSRRDGIDVKEIRDLLNAQPYRQGMGSFDVLDELDEDYSPAMDKAYKTSHEPGHIKAAGELDMDTEADVSDENFERDEKPELKPEEENSLLQSILG